MNAPLLLISLLALSIYAALGISLTRHLLRKQSPRRVLALTLLLFGVVLHGGVLVPQVFTLEGLNLNLFNVLSLTGWLMLLLSLVFSTYRPVLGLNLLALPLAGAGLLAGLVLRAPYTPLRGLSAGLEAHILLSLAAYCVLLMAAVQAVLLHLQRRELKHTTRQRIWVRLLPPLQSMESLLFDMLMLGFALLTLALGLGALTVDNLLAQHLAHKTFFSVLSWLVFAGLLWGHWRHGWRGQRAVRFTLTGFALLAVGFVGSKLVLELILGKNT